MLAVRGFARCCEIVEATRRLGEWRETVRGIGDSFQCGGRQWCIFLHSILLRLLLA